MADSKKETVEKILEIIREYKKSGIDKLPPERTLAAELKISRSMLRESLARLEAMGTVEIRNRGGVFIRKTLPDLSEFDVERIGIWPEEYIRHVMEIRFIVEIPASRLAARRRTEEDIARMRSCVVNLANVSFPDSGDEASLWDAYFHSTVIDSSHNPLLSRMYERFSAFMRNFIAFRRKRLKALNMASEKNVREHERILDSIIRQDEDGAAESMKEHLGKNLGMYEIESPLLERFPTSGSIPYFG